MRILSNSEKNFLAYCLGTVTSLNFWQLKICHPTFQPMSIIAKSLDGSGYYLVRRQASAQTTLC